MVRRPPSPKTSSVIVPEDVARPSWRRSLGAVGMAAFAYAGLCVAFFRAAGRGPDAFVVQPRAIAAANAPKWLTPADVAGLNDMGAAVRGRSILDRDLARDLAASYRESPWVAEVIHVRRAYPNRLDVALAIRKPFAVVRTASGPPVVLDPDGVRLPATTGPKGLVRLSGVGSLPPPPGQMWQKARVLDGLRVLRRYEQFINERPALSAFAAREVRVDGWSRPDARPVVKIVTARGFPVVWGVDLPDGQATIAGPSAEEKLAHLAEVLPKLARERRRIEYLNVRRRSGALLKFGEPDRNSTGGRPLGAR